MAELTTVGPLAGVKTIDAAAKQSIQSLGRGEIEFGGTGLLTLLAAVGEGIAPWWSRVRDGNLRQFWPTCGYFAGALYTLAEKLAGVPFRVEPRDPDIKSHWRLAEEYQGLLLEGAEFQQGWAEWLKKWLLDFWTQDNGTFTEIIGEGKKDGPIKGPALGLAQLDAARCTRTGNPEYPVVYQDVDGKWYRLHYTRVMYRSQLPSTMAEMLGVGFCWESRCLNVAQGLTDVLKYKQEKLGSRPLRAILVGRGVAPDNVVAAVQVAEETANARGFSRFARYPVLGNPAKTDIGVDIVNLASLPDGFDYQTDTTLGIYAIALAGGFPARWIWPATVEGATKADALYQHLAGQTSGVGGTLRVLQIMLGGDPTGPRSYSAKFLPPQLKLTFDFQDDDQDERRAQISSVRSTTRTQDLTATVVDVRTAREQMLGNGELTDSQFNDLELADWRLPDGSPVTLAVYTDNPYLQDIDPQEPDPDVMAERQTAAEAALMTATTTAQKQMAKVALACLRALQEAEKKTPPPAPVAAPAPVPAGGNAPAPEEGEPGAPGEQVAAAPTEGGASPEAAVQEAEAEETGQKSPPAGHEFYGNQWTGGGGGGGGGEKPKSARMQLTSGATVTVVKHRLSNKTIRVKKGVGFNQTGRLIGIREGARETEPNAFIYQRGPNTWLISRSNFEVVDEGEKESVLTEDEGQIEEAAAEQAEKQAEKQTERLAPAGRPLKPWPKGKKVPLSQADIDRAIRAWDKRVPQAAGILRAKEATPDQADEAARELEAATNG